MRGGGNFKGLILLAGTLSKLEEVLLFQLEDMLAESRGIMKWVLEKQLSKYRKMFEGLYEKSDEETKKIKYGGGVTLYYFKEMGEHPAAEYLEKLEKPVFIAQGEKDLQVRTERDFAGYKKLFGKRKNISFKVYEGLNHAFVPAMYSEMMKATKEFSKERHIGEEVISDIAGWILANC